MAPADPAPYSAERKRCIVSPIGQFEEELLQGICHQIIKTYRLQPTIKPVLQDLDFALDKNRNQYHSTPILARLASLLDSDVEKIIALTSADLFIPILTHVYGEAQLGGKSCIVSIARLQENLPAEGAKDEFFRRVFKEVLHELGHTFNLIHCKDPACFMHYCRSIRDVDRKSDGLCRYCTVMLDDYLKKSGYKHAEGQYSASRPHSAPKN